MLWVALTLSTVLWCDISTASAPWIWGANTKYMLESALFLSEATTGAPEGGFKLRAELVSRPYWSDSLDTHLLELQLQGPTLLMRGTGRYSDFHPHRSHWDTYRDHPFYVYWKNGVVDAVYLDHEEEKQFADYLKSIASLFQLRARDGEHNETDVTGTCHVLYETVSLDVIRKIKKRCEWPEWGPANFNTGTLSSGRITRYEIDESLHVPRFVFAEELHELRSAGRAALGMRARLWHRLERTGTMSPTATFIGQSLEEALRAAEEKRARPLRRYRLEPPAPPTLPASELEVEISEMGAAIASAEEGSADAARAHLRLVSALRRAPTPVALRLLENATAAQTDRVGALLDALGGAGTLAAHAAARAFLQLEGDPLPVLAERYLTALPAARPPHETVLADVLRLAESDRAPPEVASAARLGVAAMAVHATPAQSATVRDGLCRLLARCKDADCRAGVLRALGHLHRDDVLPLLLDHAVRPDPAPAAAALHALLAMSRLLRGPHLPRLREVVLGLGPTPRPLYIRAAALDALLAGAAHAAERAGAPMLPLALEELAVELEKHGPPELRSALWARIHDLSERHEVVRRHVAAILAAYPSFGTWMARVVQEGSTGGVVRRVLSGSKLSGHSVWLESAQLVAGGTLRRGTVLLRAVGPDADHDLLELEVTTRGLDALSGGKGDDGEDQEGANESGPAAWLSLSVASERRRPLALFTSQAELLGHVWAGTASEPVTVLAAVRALRIAPQSYLPLLTGTVLLWEARSALALRLDAQVQVSLWNRVARALVELRAGAVTDLSLEVFGAGLAGQRGLTLRAVGAADAEPALSVHADLDFYERPTLCVRPDLHDYTYTHEVRLDEALSAGGHAVWRRRVARLNASGVTLALEADNDRACRRMHAP